VILVDANLLVYAHVKSSPRHAQSREWLDSKLNSHERVGLPWESLLAFLRLVTNPRVYKRPESRAQAWKQIEAWLDCASVWVPAAGERHREILADLLPELGGGPNLVPDAHLAAIAIEHGLALCSTDGDFARFPGLRWENPLSQRAR
jgi:hypothetical protein